MELVKRFSLRVGGSTKNVRSRDTVVNSVLQALGNYGLVPVVTIEDPTAAADLGAALAEGGLPVAEITFRTASAADAIAAMATARPDILIGAGTVLTVEQAAQAVDAGAQYLISPGLNPAVVEWSQQRNIPITPGVCTPTDIETALSLGLSVLKFFPAGAFGGAKTLKALSAPYRDVRFIPTGGVNAQNLADYLSMPSVHACGGSWITPENALASGDFETIAALAREAVDIIQTVRSEK